MKQQKADLPIVKKAQKRRGTIKIQDSKGPPQGFYDPSLTILSIGDGDLSFSCSIAQWIAFKYKEQFKQFIATTYDSQVQLKQMYHLSIKGNLEKLKKHGVKVYHEIDVNKLIEYREILDPNKQKFDRIIWNFPHAGFPEQRIGPGFQWQQGFHKKHTDLIQAFFQYCHFYLKEGGKILMAHKTVQPFSIWDLPGIAEKHGYKLEKGFPFEIENYPGYENRRGAGKNGGKKFPIEDAVQYVFSE